MEGRRKHCGVLDFSAPKLARKLGVEKQRADDTRLRRRFHWFACIVLRTQKRSNATKVAIKTRTPPFSNDFSMSTWHFRMTNAKRQKNTARSPSEQDYGLSFSKSKATKEAEIPQEGFSLIFAVQNFYRTAPIYK